VSCRSNMGQDDCLRPDLPHFGGESGTIDLQRESEAAVSRGAVAVESADSPFEKSSGTVRDGSDRQKPQIALVVQNAAERRAGVFDTPMSGGVCPQCIAYWTASSRGSDSAAGSGEERIFKRKFTIGWARGKIAGLSITGDRISRCSGPSRRMNISTHPFWGTSIASTFIRAFAISLKY